MIVIKSEREVKLLGHIIKKNALCVYITTYIIFYYYYLFQYNINTRNIILCTHEEVNNVKYIPTHMAKTVIWDSSRYIHIEYRKTIYNSQESREIFLTNSKKQKNMRSIRHAGK